MTWLLGLAVLVVAMGMVFLAGGLVVAFVHLTEVNR